MTTITESIQLTVINCGNCGGDYAINEKYRAQRYEKGGGWHCPYCNCEWGYFGNTENARLKKELEAKAEEVRRAQMHALNERQLREAAERRAASDARKLKRAQNGVCPCCTRSFTNLRRHMATVHGVKNGEQPSPKKP